MSSPPLPPLQGAASVPGTCPGGRVETPATARTGSSLLVTVQAQGAEHDRSPVPLTPELGPWTRGTGSGGALCHCRGRSSFFPCRGCTGWSWSDSCLTLVLPLVAVGPGPAGCPQSASRGGSRIGCGGMWTGLRCWSPSPTLPLDQDHCSGAFASPLQGFSPGPSSGMESDPARGVASTLHGFGWLHLVPPPQPPVLPGGQ